METNTGEDHHCNNMLHFVIWCVFRNFKIAILKKKTHTNITALKFVFNEKLYSTAVA
jgi:hypothetical protein